MRVVLIGAGGHARVLLDAARLSGGLDLVAVVDARAELHNTTFGGAPVVGDERALARLRESGVEGALLGVGSVGVGVTRRRLFELVSGLGFALPTVRHPSAVVAATASLGEACVVFANAAVNPNARLGANVIVNTGATVEHDVAIGDHVHVSPGATVGGGVRIGSGSHVGIGSTIIQGIAIGDDVLVAAGAVVVRDVPNRGRVAGVPARELA